MPPQENYVMPGYQKLFKIFVATLVAALALFFVAGVVAQSGRRASKSTPAPVAAPSEEPTPAKPPVEKSRPTVTLIVGMERDSSIELSSTTNQGMVLRAAVDRLDESPAVKVERVEGNMNRGEAVRRAKAEKEAYVVLFELEIETRTAVEVKATDLALQYSVFSPGTAKVKAFGRTYPQAVRSGGVILNPRSGGIYGDYKLQQAARQAAEKILDAFHVNFATGGQLSRRN